MFFPFFLCTFASEKLNNNKNMAKSKFYELIKNATIEKDVENVYTQGINLYFPNVQVEHPFACDGLVNTKNNDNKLLKLIIEYKFNEDFQSKTTRAKVIVQVLYYLKRFEENGMILPNVVMVGDVNECFVFHTNDIIDYLDEDVDWTIAPSKAHEYNAELILKIAEEEKVNPFIFIIDNDFSFKDVVNKIHDLASNIQRYVHVTEHNIAKIFDYFTNRVIVNKKKISANDLVAIFMGVITKSDDYYKHPTKKNTLVTPQGEVKIDGNGFDSFFSYFNRNYTPQEKMKFTEISDRLIEDTNRRNKGEFYTPTLFVDYAHDMIAKEFGEDWKEKYVVWDNSAGSKNLTRDYYFKELYTSTLEQAELDISKNYNKEATSFQFDFLNDPLEKLPHGLIEAFEQNKPIIFFMNPPYATSSNMGTSGTSKDVGTHSLVNEQMKNDNIGGASKNLYAQFLYRIIMIKEQYGLTDVHIALFCKPNYLSAGSFEKFREVFFNNFSYTNGILFNASEFADVSNKWGINFSIWCCGKDEHRNLFEHKIVSNKDGEISKIGLKTIYNIDGKQRANDWIRSTYKDDSYNDYIGLTSAIQTNNGEHKYVKSVGSTLLGSMRSVSNDVYNSLQFVFMLSGMTDTTGVVPIYKENYLRCTALFSARKLVVGNWINDKDEYMKPNTEHELYQEFENDSIVYSLFNTSSNQSSLRQIEYKGKLWDIKNEFFWMSKDEMKQLANDNNNDFCYNDANVSNDRYVYTLLKDIELSPEAQAVLDKASEIVRKTFKYRQLFNEDNENYQINNFDCGWYQIKALAKEYAKDDLEEFKELYKKLSDKMLPMVYELGFLRK